jgi:hypothetical protein
MPAREREGSPRSSMMNGSGLSGFSHFPTGRSSGGVAGGLLLC